jgi:hypothetical protein
MIPQVDPLGRVYVAPAGVPVYWNEGVGYDSLGRMCTSVLLGPNDQNVSGWRLDPLGRVVVDAPSANLVYVGGLPFNNQAPINGTMARVVDQVPTASDPYVRGIRVQPAGGVHFTTTPPPGRTFLDEMSVGHILTVGENPGGVRLGYRRGQWGLFLPDDVSSLQRLFSNLNNNRLVVQAAGDKSSISISNIHIERVVPHQVFDFGPPDSVIYDGVQTDFTWIVPGFDFVLGENYEVKLS